MHHETLLYILHQLDPSRKQQIAQRASRSRGPAVAAIDASAGHRDARARSPTRFPLAGTTSLAVRPSTLRLRNYAVSGNQRRLASVSSPTAARCRSSGRARREAWFLHTSFEEIPLPLSWPVYVTHRQAEAYAPWAGMRLPTEAEYHRAAFGTPEGGERPFPWGTQDAAAAARQLRFCALRSRTGRRASRSATAPGASQTSSATAGSGRRRPLRRCPDLSRWPRIRATRPTSSTASTT